MGHGVMKMSVIGCGYLGAVHAAAMAQLGHDVIGIDVDQAKIANLAAGKAPFFEPGLENALASAAATGRIRFSTDMAEAHGSRVHFIAVGTPQKLGGNAADLTYVDAAIDDLIPYLNEGDLVVGKSTVPVGTAERLAEKLEASATGAMLAWNPEFLREGFAVHDTISPDRLVYGIAEGVAGDQAKALLDEVYAMALGNGTPLVVADYATAELVKVAANAFLATKISFINAMAEIAEATGADVTKLADALGHDNRIGRRFLNAGVGFGGGCLPKDIRAFTARAEELGLGESVAFLKEVDSINLRRRQRAVAMATESLGGSVNDRRIAVLGLAFKPNSDDVRDSPALDVAVQLKGLGGDVICHDPEAMANARAKHPQLSFAMSVVEAVTGADAIIVVTEWDDYKQLDPTAVLALASGSLVIDGRNCLDTAAWRDAGWEYRSLGRPDRAQLLVGEVASS